MAVAAGKTGKRSWVIHPLVAGVVGVFAGALTIMLLEVAGHAMAGTANPSEIASVTALMMASVLVAWVAGAFVAGLAATAWSRASSLLPGLAAGGVLLSGSVATMVAIPHPWWMAGAEKPRCRSPFAIATNGTMLSAR